MSRDTWSDEDGHLVDVVLCDYCPTHQVDGADGASPIADWLGHGWDIDPRPGRDRCPDCATGADEATSGTAGRRVDVAAGGP